MNISELLYLYLPLKANWYDMIERGEKDEEYREMTPYWMKRIYGCKADCDWCKVRGGCQTCSRAFSLKPKRFTHVCFSYGYTKRSMTRTILSIGIGKGKIELGAPNYDVIIIRLIPLKKTQVVTKNTMSIEQRLERIEKLTTLAAKDALTMDDAAAYTGLSKSYLYRLVCKKQIPYYKSEGGKQTYFAKKELCDWLLKHRVQTVTEAQEAAAAYVINNPRNKRKGGQQ